MDLKSFPKLLTFVSKSTPKFYLKCSTLDELNDFPFRVYLTQINGGVPKERWDAMNFQVFFYGKVKSLEVLFED